MSSGDLALQRLEPSMLGGSWQEALQKEFEKPYFVEMNEKLASDRALENSVPIYPPHEDVFVWSRHCNIEDVKVVIIGQDPSPYDGVACGLSFSSDQPCRSLEVIFDEMERDIGFAPPPHGDLTKWARQGVLLLNSILTVGREPMSHEGLGWQQFTDEVIRCINYHCEGVVFMLWGNVAKDKKNVINEKHHVLEACHPAYWPDGSERPHFIGCAHFSQANEILRSKGQNIDWSL